MPATMASSPKQADVAGLPAQPTPALRAVVTDKLAREFATMAGVA
jgi:hypothetical protein